MYRLHPSTVLTIAACGWLLILALNTPLASAVVAGAMLAYGMWATRSLAIVLASAALCVPVALSMLVIHAPYGDNQLIPLITSDGLLIAATLALRFFALMVCFIVAMSVLRISDIAKWLQVSRAGHKIAYIVGASLQSLPQGAQAWRTVRDANQLAGIKVTWRNTISRVVIPVISRLLIQGTERGHALAAVGFDEEGTRTLLRPVPDSAVSRVLCYIIPIGTIGVMVFVWI